MLKPHLVKAYSLKVTTSILLKALNIQKVLMGSRLLKERERENLNSHSYDLLLTIEKYIYKARLN